jgi:hypothetical protein
VSVLFRDLVFDGCGYRDIARLEEDILCGHLRPSTRKIGQGFLEAIYPFDDFRNVKAFFVVKTATDVGKADDLVSGFLHQLRRERTHVAEALHHDTAAFLVHAQLGERLIAANHHPASRGFPAAP